MGIRTRKLIGTIVMLAMLVAYALAVTSLAITVLPRANKLVELAFYAVAGLLWVLPAGLLIWWMHRPDGRG